MRTRRLRRNLRSVCLLVIVALVAAVLQIFTITTPASALPTSTAFYEPLHNNLLSTGGSLMLPLATGNTNTACLTASGNTTVVPKSCTSGTDANGSGVLRLTTSGGGLQGSAFTTATVSMTKLVDVTFNLYDSGSGAAGDGGTAFVIAASNPASPGPPATMGYISGTLGYTGTSGTNGLVNGYLGFGFDTYGNYSNSANQGSGCGTNPAYISASGKVPGQVVVRGPGTGTVGYCGINSTATNTSSAALNLRGATRTAAKIPVEVVINPGAASLTTTSGLTVAALSYLVAFTPVGGSQRTLTGALPSASGILPATYLSANGVPRQITFGWTAANGGNTDVREVDTAQAETYPVNVPVLGVTQTAYTFSSVNVRDPVTYRVVPTVDAASPAETAAVTLTETLPSGVTPLGGYGTGWTCTVNGQVVTCMNSNGPFLAGSALNTVTIVGVVSNTITAATIRSSSTAVVSSSDGVSASTSTSANGGIGKTPTGVVLSPNTGPAAGGTTISVSAGLDGSANSLVNLTAITVMTDAEFSAGTRVTLFPCQGSATTGCFIANADSTVTIPSMPAHAVGVVALNFIALGSALSANYTFTSPSPPNAPASASATAGIQSAVVSWTAPSNNNGSPVTSYTVTPFKAGVAQAAIVTGTTALSTTVSGLTAGVSYTFAVAATNTCTGTNTACGTGATATSNAVVPNALPAAPTAVAANAGTAQATVTWTAPAANGGTAITSYVITPFLGATAQTTQTAAAGATSLVVTGLTAGSAYTFTIAALNAAGTGASSAATNAVTINAGPVVGATAPAAGEVAVPYTTTFTATGGTTPYTWSLASGTFPTGLSLAAGTGVLSGTPTAAGSFPFTVQANDSGGGTATKAVTLVIAAAPAVVFAPAAGEITVVYSQQATTTGGTAPYGPWSITAGSLPAGVTLNTSTGVISGTPTASGTFSLTLSITDAFGKVANKTASIVIAVAPTLTSTPTAGQVGFNYGFNFAATGGTGPFTYSVTAGTLPPGQTLASTGLLSGAPSKAGTYPFTVKVVDSFGLSALDATSMTIAPAAVSVTKTANVTSTAPGAVITFTITATNSSSTTSYPDTQINDPLSDVLDDAVYNNDATASSGTLTYARPNLTWNIPMTAGSTFTLTYSVTVSNPDAGNKLLTGIVSTNFVSTNCNPGDPDSRCSAPVPVAVLSIVKTASAATTTPGSVVTYTVVVTNTGQTTYAAQSATFTDSLAGILDDATYNTATASVGTVSYTSPTISWNGNLAVGASATITYSVTVANPDTGNKSLTGTIVSSAVGSNCPSGAPTAGCSATVTVLVPALVINNAIATPTPQLLGHWIFDEGTGTTAADSAGSHPATLSGVAGWAPGVQGPSALSTDGNTGIADTGAAVLNTSSSFSVSALVKLNSVSSNWQAIVTQDGTYNSGFYLQYRGDSQRFTFMTLASDSNNGSAVYAADALAAPLVGQWYRVTGVYDASASTLSLYVDGVLQHTVTASPAWAAAGHLVIGRAKFGGSPGNFLNGSIDDVQAYSGVLTGASPAATTPGAVLPLTTTISNSGQTAYTATSVTLALPAAADDAVYNGDAAASSGSLVYNSTANTLVWTGNLAVGAVVRITATMTVRNPDPGDKTVTTVASSAAAGSSCPAGSTNSTCTAAVQVLVPALTITKAANVSSTTPGSVVQYTVTVTNNGQTNYTGATFADGLTGIMDDAAYTSASATTGVVSFTSPTLTWTGDLLVGATATITYSVTVNNPDTGNKSLAATITSTTAGSNCASGSGDTRCSSTVAVLIPSLTVSAAVDSATTTPGSVVNYTVTATNSGPTTYTAIPVTFGFTGVTDDATYNNNGTATVGSLAVGASGAVWTVTLAPGASATATLSFTVKSPDTGDKAMPTVTSSDAAGSTCPTGSANTACKTATTVLIPGLTIVKTANVATAVTGSTVVYTIVVTNSGQSAYAAANFTDSLSTVLTDATYAGGLTATSGTASYAAPVISWTGALGVGASATISYSITILDPDPGDKRITNAAVSTSPGSNCPAGATDTRCFATVNIVVPGLTIVKTANASTTVPGAVVGYTVTVTNSGQTAYTGAAFTDSLTGVLDDATYNTNVAASSGSATYASSTIGWTGDLAVGAVATITYSVTVNTAAGGNNLIADTAVSATKGNNCAAGSVDARCTVTVPVARLIILAVATEPTTTPGSVVHLTTTITNTGQVPYTGITLSSTGADLNDDVVPNGDQTTSSGTTTIGATSSTWTGNVPVGGVVTLTLSVTVLNPDPGNKIITSTWTSTAPGNNCAAGSVDSRCTILSRVLIPGLTISTTANVASVAPAGVTTYTVTIRNSGETPYSAATVTDSLTNVLDDATYNADASASAGAVSFSTPTLTWTGSIAVGATVTVTFSVTTRSPDPGDKVMSNVVSSAAVGNTCPVSSGNAACTATVAVLTPALTIVKTANVTAATLGSTVRFTVVVTNSGQTPYTGATYTDNLGGVLDDANYNNDSSLTVSAGSITIVPPSLIWTGDLAVGASATISYTDTVYNPDTGDRSLTGTIVSSTPGSNCATGSVDSRCSAVVPVINSVSLTFTKTASVATTVAGAVVTYTDTAVNASTSPIAANFTDPLAGILDDAVYNTNAAVVGDGSVAYAGGSLTWSGTVPAGGTVTVTYTVIVNATITGNEILTGTITSTLPAASNNCLTGSGDTRCTSTVPIAALVIQSLNSGTTTPGSVILTTTTFTNTGQVPYVGISISSPGSDLLDDVTSAGDQHATSGSISVSLAALVWTGDIPVGGVVTMTSTITVNNPDNGNKLIKSTSTSTAPGNNCQSGSTDPRCTLSIAVLIPGLTISTTADTPNTTPGATVNYTITVTNSGETPYTGAVVTNSLASLLDDAVYNADATATAGTVTFGSPTLTWTGDLAVGATATVHYSVTARSPDPGDKSMINPVSSTNAGSSCPPAGVGAACRTSVVVLTPGLTIVKTANQTTANLGSTVTYTVVVTNSGQTTYPAATFTDSLAAVTDDAVYNGDAATTGSGSLSYATGVLTWTGALAPGATATITYTVTVRSPDPGNLSMANTVVSTSTGNNCLSGSADTRCTAVVAIANTVALTFNKTADVATTAGGGIVQYTVMVTNSSTSPISADFTDPLTGILDDANYNGNVAASSGTAGYANPNVTWNGSIPALGTVTVTYSVTVHAAITGNQLLSDTVTSSTLPASNNCAAGSLDTRCATTIPVARLDLVQTATETNATPGSVVHVTALYTNTGKVAYSGISVTSPRADTSDDTIPTGDQVATSGTLVRTTTSLTWTGDIPVGGSVTVTRTLIVQNPDPGNQRITATLTSAAVGNNCPGGSTDPRCTFLVTVVTPGLTITATASVAATVPGGTVGYTVTVKNTGQTAYTGASFTDPLDGLLNDATYNTDAAASIGTLSYTASTLTWTGDLAIGATATITFSFTVKNPDTGDKTMANEVTSTTVGSTCPPASSNTACRTTVLVLTPALTIVKTASLPTVTLGSTVTYTIVVTNSGQTAYSAANFSDSLSGVLDDATYNADAAATSGTIGYSGGVLTWTGALAVGASATVTYTVTVANPDTGDRSMSNTATSTSTGNNCVAGTDTRCTAVVAVVNAVTLTFVNTADVLSTVAGAVVHYTVTVTNSSASAIVGANFTDPLAGITDDATYNANASATSGSVSYTSPNLTWNGDVPAGGTVTVTYSVTVNTAVTGDQILTGTLTSTSSPSSDNCISGNTGPRCTSTIPVAALLLSQSYTETTTTPGSVVHLTATFTNTGKFPYTGITISSPSADTVDDAIPAGDQTASSGNLVLTAAGIVWTGDIPVGGVVTVVGTVTVQNPDPGNKILTGTLVSAAPGNNCPSGGADPRCTATSTVLLPGLTITKSVSTPTTTPGSSVGYTISIHNTGQTPYSAATVTDSLTGVLDDATYNADAASSSGTPTYTAPTLTWTGALAIGATVTVTFSVTVKNPDPGDKSLVDSAVSSDVGSTCPVAAGAAACRSSVDVLTPGLTIVKTASVSTATMGSTVRFTVVVTNSGQTPYSGATYTDNLAGVLDDANYNNDQAVTSGSISIDPPSLIWTGDLAVGASATISYTDTVYNPDAGDRLLTGTIVSSTTGSNCATGSIDPRCSAVVPVTNAVSLTLTKTANVTTTVAGGVVGYTITAVNASTAPIDANFTDPLAGIIDDATYNGNATASSGTVTYNNPSLTWAGTIAAGATVIVTYTVTVHATITGDELLTGTLTSTTTPGSNDCAAGSLDTRCTNTVPIAALVIVQSFSTPTTTPGSVIGIGATFTNTGQVPYVGITIAGAAGTDDLGDDATANGDQTASSGVLSIGSTGPAWTGDIPVGATVTIGGTVTIKDPDTGNRVLSTTLASSAAGNNCPPGSADIRCVATATVLLPGLTITTAGTPAALAPAGVATFTVTIHNTGQTAYTAISVTDNLAGVLDDAVYNADPVVVGGGTVAFASPTLTWTGNLAVDATVTVTFSVTARSPDPGDKTMVNTVSSPVQGSSCLPGAGTPACSNTVVVLTPALTIVKTADQTTTTLGSIVTYMITATNSGQTPYSAADFTDSLAGVTDDATYRLDVGANLGTAVVSAGGVLTWTGALNPGDSAVITYSVTVNSPRTGDLSMSNTVTSTTAGNNCTAGSVDTRCTAIVAITNSVSVTFTKTPDVTSSVAGGIVNYTVSIVNASVSPVVSNFTDSLTGVLDDAAYAGGAAASVGTVTFTDPNLTWSGTVPGLSTVTVTYAVTVDAVGTGDENLTDTLTSTAPAGSNNCLPGSTDVRCSIAVPLARLTLAYSSLIAPTITPGGIVHYVSTYTNTGKVPYVGISVETLAADAADDQLPGTQTVTSGTLVLGPTGITWTGDIPVGGVVTLDALIPVKNPDTGNKLIQTTMLSTATGNNCFSGSVDPRCTNIINVLVPGLTITQTANVPSVNPGGTAQYTLVVHNSGQTPYTGAVVTDSLVGVLDDAAYNGDATATAAAVSYSRPNLTWTGDLAVGASVTIIYTVTAGTPDTGDKVMANNVASAEVGSSCLPGGASVGCSTVVAVLTPALTFVSSANVSTTAPGAVVTYTVTATNTGQTAYATAAFNDPLAGILDDAVYNGDASAGGAGTVTYAGGVLGWSGPLALAASVTVTFSVTVGNPDGGDHLLGQTLTSTNQGANCPALAGTDPRCSTSVPVASMRLVSTADVTTTKPTGVVHYTNTFTNTGQVPYVGITVLISVQGASDDTTYNDDATATTGTVSIVLGAPTLSWTGDLPVGATVVFTASVTVKNPDPGDKLINTSMTSTAAGSNCPVGGVDPVCSNLVTVQIPGLTITKVADVTTTTPGATVTYTLTIANTGQTAYTAATVTDPLGGVLNDATYSGGASATQGAVTYSAPVLTWTGDLAVGASAVVTYAVVVSNPDLGDKSMVNTAVSNELGSNCPTGGTAPACTSSVTVLVPALAISVTSNSTTTTPGSIVGYTLTISNIGQTPYNAVSVAASLAGVVDDAVYTASSATSGSVSFAAPNLTWTGDLAVGATAVVSYTVTVGNPDVGNQVLTTSVASAAAGGTCTAAAPCVNNVTVLTPGLAVSTTANVATATPGDHVIYTITVANTGQTAYVGTTVTADLSRVTDDATFDGTITASLGVAGYTAPTLTWTGSLPVGTSAVITYSVTVLSPDPGNKLMPATVVADSAGSTCPSGSSNPACTASVTVLIPALTIVQSADQTSVIPGTVVNYTILVTNTGQTPYTGATVTDVLTGVIDDAVYGGDAAVTGGGTVGYLAPTLTWTGDLIVGASATITYSVTVRNPDPGDKLMVQTATSTTPGSTCPVGATVPACSTSVQVLVPKLTVTQTADRATVVAGSAVQYTITLVNGGQTDLAPATLSDSLTGILDDAVYADDVSATAGIVDISGSALTWSGPLDMGATVTITFSVTTNFPGTGNHLLSNTALSPTQGSNCITGTDPLCVTSVVVLVPALTISQTASTNQVVAGGAITYTIIARNTGQADYPAATITDSLANVLTNAEYNTDATATTGAVSYTAPSLNWTGALPVGASVTIVYSVKTNVGAASDATLVNAVVSSSVGSTCTSAAATVPPCATTTTVAARTIGMSGLTSGFTMTGIPKATVTADGAITMTITTNSPAGYTVTVEASSDVLTGSSGAGGVTIPLSALLVRENDTHPWVPVTSIVPVLVHQQETASAPGGDAVSNDYQMLIPFVPNDTYTTTLDYIATAN